MLRIRYLIAAASLALLLTCAPVSVEARDRSDYYRIGSHGVVSHKIRRLIQELSTVRAHLSEFVREEFQIRSHPYADEEANLDDELVYQTDIQVGRNDKNKEELMNAARDYFRLVRKYELEPYSPQKKDSAPALTYYLFPDVAWPKRKLDYDVAKEIIYEAAKLEQLDPKSSYAELVAQLGPTNGWETTQKVTDELALHVAARKYFELVKRSELDPASKNPAKLLGAKKHLIEKKQNVKEDEFSKPIISEAAWYWDVDLTSLDKEILSLTDGREHKFFFYDPKYVPYYPSAKEIKYANLRPERYYMLEEFQKK